MVSTFADLFLLTMWLTTLQQPSLAKAGLEDFLTEECPLLRHGGIRDVILAKDFLMLWILKGTRLLPG